MRILIVEHDDKDRLHMGRALEHQGFDVSSASCCAEAIATMEKDTFAFVLLNLNDTCDHFPVLCRELISRRTPYAFSAEHPEEALPPPPVWRRGLTMNLATRIRDYTRACSGVAIKVVH